MARHHAFRLPALSALALGAVSVALVLLLLADSARMPLAWAAPTGHGLRRVDAGEVMAARGPVGAFWLTEYVVATVTLFNSDMTVNLNAIDEQAAALASFGARAVFICGTTGESMSLSVDERKAIAERWRVAATKYGLVLVVHVGTATPVDAADLANHAARIGADAIAAMAPFFFKPQTVDDVVDFLAMVGGAAPGVPLYYYHIPSMTGVNIPVADILAAAVTRVPSLRGAKFSDSDLYEFGRCVGLRDPQGATLNLLYGRDEMILGALAIGADGGVGSTYNLPFMRPIYVNLWNAWATGNITAARAAQERSRHLVELMKTYGSGALKSMLQLANPNLPVGPPRPPQQPLTAAQLQQLHADLVREGFLAAAAAAGTGTELVAPALAPAATPPAAV